MNERRNSNFLQDCFFFNKPAQKRNKKVSLVPLVSVQSSLKGWKFKENCRSLQSLDSSPNDRNSKGLNGGKTLSYPEDRKTPEGSQRKTVKLPSLKPQIHNKNFSVRSSAALKVMNRKLFVTEEKKDMEVTFSNNLHTPAPMFGDYNFLAEKNYL